jgi:Protein of unknown function (DUF1638)
MPSVPRSDPAPAPRRVLLVACGALVKEVRAALQQLPAVEVDVAYLPAPLHNRPSRIEPGVRSLLDATDMRAYDGVALGYGDCGTAGGLDRLCRELTASLGIPVTMIDGPHCFSFFAGPGVTEAIEDEEPGTFYLTDFLAKHADSMLFGALGLDRHPELRDAYFGNYRRVCLLSQTDDPSLVGLARSIADRLGLELIVRHTGMTPFVTALGQAVGLP